MKKILMLFPSLGLGGMERSMVTLLRAHDRRRFRFDLIGFAGGPLAAELPDDIGFSTLRPLPRFNFPLQAWPLRRIISEKKPDVVVSWGNYCNWVSALAAPFFGPRPRLIFSEHINPAAYLAALPSRPRAAAERGLYRLYSRADAVVAVSQGASDALRRDFGVDAERLRVLANPIDSARIRELAAEPADHPWFGEGLPVVMFIGRFDHQKDLPTLLSAFASLRRRLPARLVLVGSGPAFEPTRALAARAGLLEDVAFLGYQPNPYKYLARASLLCLSSIFEGFSLVIREAQVLGVPVVSTRCPSGPEEAVTDGVDGLLVPMRAPEALARAAERLLTEPELRARLSAAAKKRVLAVEPVLVARGWEALYEG